MAPRGRSVGQRFLLRTANTGRARAVHVASSGKQSSAWVAQLVERVLGKDEVTGSIPVPGSRMGEGRAGVTQWKSLGLPSRWSRVRIPSPAPLVSQSLVWQV